MQYSHYTALVCLGLLSGCSYFSSKKELQQKQENSKEDFVKSQAKKTIFSFLGAPGSGKGTLATECVKTLGFKVLSTGNLCREHIARGDEIGKAIDGLIKAGKLIPDETVTNMVEDWLKKETTDGAPIILDGYPRTQKQAELFLELLKKDFSSYGFRVVSLVIPDEEIVKRLSDRLVCENKNCQVPTAKSLLKNPEKLVCEHCGAKLIRREDDKEDVVRERLRVYTQFSGSLINFYKDSGLKIEELQCSSKSVKQIFELFEELFS